MSNGQPDNASNKSLGVSKLTINSDFEPCEEQRYVRNDDDQWSVKDQLQTHEAESLDDTQAMERELLIDVSITYHHKNIIISPEIELTKFRSHQPNEQEQARLTWFKVKIFSLKSSDKIQLLVTPRVTPPIKTGQPPMPVLQPPAFEPPAQIPPMTPPAVAQALQQLTQPWLGTPAGLQAQALTMAPQLSNQYQLLTAVTQQLAQQAAQGMNPMQQPQMPPQGLPQGHPNNAQTGAPNIPSNGDSHNAIQALTPVEPMTTDSGPITNDWANEMNLEDRVTKSKRLSTDSGKMIKLKSAFNPYFIRPPRNWTVGIWFQPRPRARSYHRLVATKRPWQGHWNQAPQE